TQAVTGSAGPGTDGVSGSDAPEGQAERRSLPSIPQSAAEPDAPVRVRAGQLCLDVARWADQSGHGARHVRRRGFGGKSLRSGLNPRCVTSCPGGSLRIRNQQPALRRDRARQRVARLVAPIRNTVLHNNISNVIVLFYVRKG